MKISVCLGEVYKGRFTWIDLPIDVTNEDEKEDVVNFILKYMKTEIGIDLKPDEIFIVDISVKSISDNIYKGFKKIFNNEGIDSFIFLNNFINNFQNKLTTNEQQHVESVLAYDSYVFDLMTQMDADSVIDYILEQYEFIPEVTTEEELGEYIYTNYHAPIDDTLSSYIDFEEMGSDFVIETAGDFTEYGYIYGL